MEIGHLGFSTIVLTMLFLIVFSLTLLADMIEHGNKFSTRKAETIMSYQIYH